MAKFATQTIIASGSYLDDDMILIVKTALLADPVVRFTQSASPGAITGDFHVLWIERVNGTLTAALEVIDA